MVLNMKRWISYLDINSNINFSPDFGFSRYLKLVEVETKSIYLMI
jgi:hypothetical protein